MTVHFNQAQMQRPDAELENLTILFLDETAHTLVSGGQVTGSKEQGLCFLRNHRMSSALGELHEEFWGNLHLR